MTNSLEESALESLALIKEVHFSENKERYISNLRIQLEKIIEEKKFEIESLPVNSILCLEKLAVPKLKCIKTIELVKSAQIGFSSLAYTYTPFEQLKRNSFFIQISGIGYLRRKLREQDKAHVRQLGNTVQNLYKEATTIQGHLQHVPEEQRQNLMYNHKFRESYSKAIETIRICKSLNAHYNSIRKMLLEISSPTMERVLLVNQ